MNEIDSLLKNRVEIKSISIVQLSYGPDIVYLNTSLPEPFWPFNGYLDLKFSATRGTGEEYCKRNFPGIPIIKIIKIAGVP